MNRSKMPKLVSRFELAGIPIEVIKEIGLVDRKSIIGEARYSKQQIAIDPNAAPKETTEQSLWHELVHWCLYIMGEDELRTNEKFVDLFAHLLYQYDTSKVYDET